MRCSDCNICIHMYVCNCSDSLIRNTICKQVHLLQRFLFPHNFQNGDCNLQHQEAQNEKEEVAILTDHLRHNGNLTKDVKIVQERLKENLIILAEEVTKCDDKYALQQFETHINSAKHLLASLRNRAPLNQLQCSRPCPGNKRIERQTRFYSTKKKRKSSQKVRFSKPTRSDKERLFSKEQKPDLMTSYYQEIDFPQTS